jgi:hypothetical protein
MNVRTAALLTAAAVLMSTGIVLMHEDVKGELIEVATVLLPGLQEAPSAEVPTGVTLDDLAPCSVRQHHRQKSQIIVQDHPPHQAVPRTQRVAQPAVGGAERLTVRRRQPVIRRPHIAEHLSEHP